MEECREQKPWAQDFPFPSIHHPDPQNTHRDKMPFPLVMPPSSKVLARAGAVHLAQAGGYAEHLHRRRRRPPHRTCRPRSPGETSFVRFFFNLSLFFLLQSPSGPFPFLSLSPLFIFPVCALFFVSIIRLLLSCPARHTRAIR